MNDNNQNPVPVNRRTFLATIPAALAVAPLVTAADVPKLAIEGGKPVRTVRLTGFGYPGARLYDEQEKAEVLEAYATKTLFRYYGPGKPNRVEQLEKEFAAFMGAKYVLAVTSGTAALHVALTALGIGPGDEVILPAWAWHSCYTTIVLTGALPVFAEVDESLAIDPVDLEAKITPQTKAVMVVQPEGVPADMGRIMTVARKHGLKVLEDVAQSCGAQYKGKRLGTIGDIGVYSFQMHKLITAGEGGAVATNDPLLYERACRFQDLGLLRDVHENWLGKPNEKLPIPGFPGTNYRMNEMTGGVMRGQLRKLESLLSQLRQNGRFVRERLQDLPGLKLRVSHDPDGEIGWTVGFLLPSRKMRDRFVAAVEAENIPVGSPSSAEVLPPLPYVANKAVPHPEWPSFNSPRGKAIRYGTECCPRTQDIFGRTAKLTISRTWSESDLKDIVEAITKVHRAIAV
jgi:8-amino-3,8-dideoxy-alpha-D-manno-octulosonate transaminase